MRMAAKTRSTGQGDHGASILVTALASFFGVVLIQATAFLLDIFGDDGEGAVAVALYCVAMVFILLSLYVASVVTANTFATIVAGRTKTIALLRLLGASGRELRRSVSHEGLSVGLFGAAVGAILGIATSHLARSVAVAAGTLPDLTYTVVQPLVALPVVIVVGTTWMASHVGAKRVLEVTPIRATFSIVLIAGGTVLLGLGVLIGSLTPAGVLVAFFGGAASFTGIMVGAHHIVPWVLRLVGRAFGNTPAAWLAAANATRYPERSTRTALGLLIGVTLVVTFAVATYSYRAMLQSEFDDESLDQVMAVTVGIMSGLIGFAGVIAAVGMVNNLLLSIMQRTRELGLLRALGFTRKQIRGMILAESAQMVIASMGFGLLLGIVYGWAAAQSLLGSIAQSGVQLPTLPWAVIAGTILCAGLLALGASLVPSRRANAISPIAALS
jgi:putative ABC transport system permease protein